MNIAANRWAWLGLVKSRKWERKDGRTCHSVTGRKMPEPVYWWLVEHKLIVEEDGSLALTQSGREVLENDKPWEKVKDE